MDDSSTSAKKWFWKRLTQELFVLSFFAWGILVFFELAKPGVVSNYLSVTHLGFIVFLLGFFFLVQQPSVDLRPSLEISSNQQMVLSVLSIFMGVAIFFITDLPPILTLALIFVTVSALWAGSYLLIED